MYIKYMGFNKITLISRFNDHGHLTEWFISRNILTIDFS